MLPLALPAPHDCILGLLLLLLLLLQMLMVTACPVSCCQCLHPRCSCSRAFAQPAWLVTLLLLLLLSCHSWLNSHQWAMPALSYSKAAAAVRCKGMAQQQFLYHYSCKISLPQQQQQQLPQKQHSQKPLHHQRQQQQQRQCSSSSGSSQTAA
jgi:hypothetical protein